MGYGHSLMKKPLKGKQGNLPLHLQKDILAASPTKRLKYCSGKSKPFKKSKKY